MKRKKRNQFFRKMRRTLISFGEFLAANKKRVMPIILLICVAVTILIAIHANRTVEDQSVSDANAQDSGAVDFEATKTELVQDAYPEINAIIEKYYEAIVSGDVSILNNGLYRTLDEIDTIKVEEGAQYTEEIQNLRVYTKPGPVENSYVVYAVTDVRYIGCDDFLPAAMTFYVCMDENGTYYINADERSQSVNDYIKEVSLQDDVVDLFNRVNVEYKDKVESNKMLSELVAAIYAQIEESVGERLAASGADQTDLDGTEETGGNAATASSTLPKEVRIRAKTTVKVRTHDSTEADVLGMAEKGDVFIRIAEQPNGWSQISFAGSGAYVKSEFFEVVEDTNPGTGASSQDETGDDAATGASADASAAATTVTKKTTSSVRMRKEPNTNAEIITTLNSGTEVKVTESRDDGWCAVDVNGKTGYVKAEFLKD